MIIEKHSIRLIGHFASTPSQKAKGTRLPAESGWHALILLWTAHYSIAVMMMCSSVGKVEHLVSLQLLCNFTDKIAFEENYLSCISIDNFDVFWDVNKTCTGTFCTFERIFVVLYILIWSLYNVKCL